MSVEYAAWSVARLSWIVRGTYLRMHRTHERVPSHDWVGQLPLEHRSVNNDLLPPTFSPSCRDTLRCQPPDAQLRLKTRMASAAWPYGGREGATRPALASAQRGDGRGRERARLRQRLDPPTTRPSGLSQSWASSGSEACP